MTQTHYENISLEMVVKSSKLILVVQKRDPFITNEIISILPEGSIFSGKNNPPYYEPPYHDSEFDKNQTKKNYPPFDQTVYHFKVVKELFNSTEASLVGNNIQVLEADNDSRLDLHKMYYLEGRRKSPVYPVYQSALKIEDFEKVKSLIIFVDSHKSRYILCCRNSYERISNLQKVNKLIKGSMIN